MAQHARERQTMLGQAAEGPAGACHSLGNVPTTSLCQKWAPQMCPPGTPTYSLMMGVARRAPHIGGTLAGAASQIC